MVKPKRCLVLGIDEAGYGPNLGPLVITCSAWIIEKECSIAESAVDVVESLLDRMSPVFLPQPLGAKRAHLPLGDSKGLYSSGNSLDSLALGVRFWTEQVGSPPQNFDDLLQEIAPHSHPILAQIAWYRSNTPSIKSAEAFVKLDRVIPRLLLEDAAHTCVQLGIEFLGLSGTVIDEQRFNADVERLGNKASLLSHHSLQLAATALDRYGQSSANSIDSIHVYCDKHGGRNRYQALLMDALPDLWFEAIGESPRRSDYRARWNDLELQWSFLAKGDRLVPSALSSMAAKWIREALMARLNEFWRALLPDLKPTAGYPVDAQRFRQSIEPISRQLALPIHHWWRLR